MNGYCNLCGRWEELEEHHLWAGSLRPVSEQYGMKVMICWKCHREGDKSAHKRAETRLRLQKIGEREFLRRGGTVEEFIKAGFKNVLDEDEIDEALITRCAGVSPKGSRDNASAFRLIDEPELLPF